MRLRIAAHRKLPRPMLFSVIASTAFASAPDMSNADLSGRWDAHASLNSCTFSGATDREGASSGVAIDGREDIVHAIAHNGFIRGSHCWANPKTTERLYGTDMVCRNFHGVVDIETGEFLANMQCAYAIDCPCRWPVIHVHVAVPANAARHHPVAHRQMQEMRT